MFNEFKLANQHSILEAKYMATVAIEKNIY